MKTKYIIYPLAEGRFVNRFLETEIYQKQEQFKDTVMGGKINEWLKYGFSINDNPCRKEFISLKLATHPALPVIDDWYVNKTIDNETGTVNVRPYFPFGNVNVDHSGFWHIPTSLNSWYITWIESPVDIKNAEIKIHTPGGVTLWMDDEEVCCFRPFTRNMVKHTSFIHDIKKGIHTFKVYLEDFAERDTDYYFRIELPENTDCKICLPFPENYNEIGIRNAEKLLSDMCIVPDIQLKKQLNICFENSSEEKQEVSILITDASRIPYISATEKIPHGKSMIALKAGDNMSPAVYSVVFSMEVEGVAIRRVMAAQITGTEYTDLEPLTISERKKKILEFAVKMAPETSYKAIALLAEGSDDKLANKILQDELPGIRQHKDCSDFFLIAHLYALKHFRNRLEPKTIEMMTDAILTFRYWIDEPGNDVMWFFSENHALGFHSCEYIAGQLFPDAYFPVPAMKGTEISKKAAGLLEDWFNAFDHEFMTEWNSNAYMPVDATAFGFLMLMVEPDDPFLPRIIKALDRLYLCLAQYSLKNTYLSSYGRSYERQLRGNLTNGTTSMLYLGYGVGCITSAIGPLVPLCLTDYEPPVEYRKYIDLDDKQFLWQTNNQGWENHVNLTLYKTKNVLLSTANGFKPYMPGYQEHICQAAVDANANVFVNHPGETHAYGSGRPCYWAGNGNLPLALQEKDFTVMRYKIPKDSIVQYTHVSFPADAFDSVVYSSNWCAGEKEDGFIYVWALNGLRKQVNGPYQREELISDGLENCWFIRVADRTDYATLNEFIAASACELLEKEENSITLKTKAHGRIMMKDDATLYLNGCATHPVFTEEGMHCIERR